MAAEKAAVDPGGILAVWGYGPVGLLTIKSAFALGEGSAR
jgi:threonine dehydrogenase-like Zn-dependent dehydrogenase